MITPLNESSEEETEGAQTEETAALDTETVTWDVTQEEEGTAGEQ